MLALPAPRSHLPDLEIAAKLVGGSHFSDFSMPHMEFAANQPRRADFVHFSRF